MKAQVNIKLEPTIKRAAQKRAKMLGLSLSSVVNATLSQFARTGELHVAVSPTPTKYLQDIIKEARKEHKAGKSVGPFATVGALIADLES